MLTVVSHRIFCFVLLVQILFALFLITPVNAAQERQTSRSSEAEALRAYESGEFIKARDLWQKLAEAGDKQAMNNLGALYDQGKGMEIDAGRAVYWFEKAARAGHPAGMSNYGRMLEAGRGIAANPQEAALWLDKAAREGQPEAQFNLGLLYEQGRGVAQDDKTAAAWYARAAAQQQVQALARLGHCYRVGRGVARDISKATLFFYAAAMNGQTEAIRELEELAKEGPKRPAAMLFGQKLDNSDRAAMREALRKANVPVVRENAEFICDIYNVRALIQGAGEMAVCYAPGKSAPVGFVKIDYSAATAVVADNVVKMLAGRFGEPSAVESGDARLWNLGTTLVATQYMPTHKMLSLMYMVPHTYYLTRQAQENNP